MQHRLNQRSNLLPIEEIWKLRRCGQPAAAEQEFLNFKRILQLSLRMEDWSRDLAELNERGFELQDLLELLVLKISFLLREGSHDAAHRQMRRLNEWIDTAGARRSYHFEFQAAAIHYVRGDYSAANQGFARASELAVRTSFQFPKARLNKMLSMESLGILQYSEIEKFTAEIQSQNCPYPADDEFLHQLTALELRHRLSSKPVAEIFTDIELAPEAEQAQYYAGWISQLPYIQHELDPAGKIFDQAVQNLANIKDGYRARFRLHTLLCNPEAIDADLEAQPGAADIAERLYLWTWHWLQDPSNARAESLIHFAHRSLNSNIIFRETDRILVINALSWILLMSGHNPTDFFNGGGDSATSKQSLPIALRLESKLLSSLRWHAQGLQLDASCKQEILALMDAAQQHGYRSLTSLASNLIGLTAEKDQSIDPRFELLHHAISSMRSTQIGTDSVIRLRMMSGCINIHDAESDCAVRIPKLAALLSLMADRGYASTTEVALLVLNLSVRAMDDATARIDKLLWRANKDLGKYLNLTRRGSIIYLESKYRISVDIPARYQSLLIFADQIPAIASSLIKNQDSFSTGSQQNELTRPSHPPRMCRLSRRDLEIALKVSRPTANRLLRSWLDEGKIRKIEETPLPTYEIAAELLTNAR